ncbi:hypothetical protein F5Y17DRAFT_142993 [Xylariaceae sp. FL0594]|nr:hypothetical protein F5Y17DRAFT_142993 [Xylariaceae sp. FL0594]
MSSGQGISLFRASSHLRLAHSHRLMRPSLATSQNSLSSVFRQRQHSPLNVRTFHWQSGLDAAIEGTQSLIVELHAVTHLPWFLSIPLTAAGVGLIFRLPFTVYTQRILQRRAELTPLLQAWNARIQQDVEQEEKNKPSNKVSVSARLSEVKKRQDKALKRMYGKLGLQTWKMYSSVLSFPFWLLAIDGVRRLCGGPRGLLGSLLTGASSDTAGSAAASTTSVVVDPSLTVEGFLWFPDLTASDPYHVLPFVLSATLLWNVLPPTRGQLIDRFRTAVGRPPLRGTEGPQSQPQALVPRSERMRSSFHLALIGLSALIGPVTMDLPAALHLYWIASSATNAVVSRAIKKLMPVKMELQKRCMGVELPLIRPLRK